MKSLTVLLLSLLFTYAGAQTVSTVAGITGVVGSANGPAASSTFNNPHGVACDNMGNVYIANRYGHTIRKITPGGTVSTFAGTGSAGATDGMGTAASFNEPWAVACDTLGNVYVADTKNYKIRKINSAGLVTTVAGTGIFGVTNGLASVAQFGFPSGIAVSKDGSTIYVADRMTHTIRKIDSGNVSTIAGVVYSPGDVDGAGSVAKFDHPYALALDLSGFVLVTDEYNNKIRRVSSTGQVTTFAGNGTMGSTNGPALSASFNAPWGICVMSNGDILIGDANNFTVRKISSGTVSVYAGQDGIPGSVNGPALSSTFNGVSALWFNTVANAVYLCDPFSQLVRKITPLNSTTLSLTTTSGSSSFCAGSSVVFTALPGNLTNYIFYDGAVQIGTSANGIFYISTLSVGAHTITCTAVDGGGVTITSNPITITITSSLSVSILTSGSTNICMGESVTLTSSVTGTYLWSTGATSASIQVSAAGTYTLTVTNGQGCSGQSAPVQVTTLTAPNATVSAASTLPLCPGDSVMLTAGTATSYQWSNGATTQSTYATGPGNYTVLVTNGAGCSAISLPVAVTFYPASASSISPSGTVLIPQGSSVTLTANSGSAYQWSTSATTQTLVVNTPGTYTVTVTNNNGCKSTPATVQVSYISPSNMISAHGATTFCEGDSVRLTSVFPSGNQWYWNGTAIPGADQPIYYASFSGYYKVRNTPASGTPVFSDSIQVTVNTLPNTITSVSDTVCQGSQAILSVQPISGITFRWYDVATGGSSLSTGLSFTTPALQQTQPFYVELLNASGCVKSNRFTVTAIMHPQPDATFESTAANQTASGFEVMFTNTSINANAYYWDFGDTGSPDNNSSDPNPAHNYSQPGDYNVILIAANSEGCIDTLAKIISVTLDNNIFIPSGFTPNNDGNNDLFRVRGNNIRYSDISIFNQWGQRIWNSPKEQNGWDGNSNGQPVGNGSFAYVIEVTYDDGGTEVFRGNINVIR